MPKGFFTTAAYLQKPFLISHVPVWIKVNGSVHSVMKACHESSSIELCSTNSTHEKWEENSKAGGREERKVSLKSEIWEVFYILQRSPELSTALLCRADCSRRIPLSKYTHDPRSKMVKKETFKCKRDTSRRIEDYLHSPYKEEQVVVLLRTVFVVHRIT
jgi:hypothetical protein